MSVIWTTDEERDVWQPLADDALKIVRRGADKEDVT